MGYYYIPCQKCGETFGWFSGNSVVQLCSKCEGNQTVTNPSSFKMIHAIPAALQNEIEVFKLNPIAKLPTRNISTDGGIDLYALEPVFIPVGETAIIKTGIAINVPEGCIGKIFDRSSMAKKGLIVGAGVVDTGFSGDCSVILHNFSAKDNNDPLHHVRNGYVVNGGDKIAQLVLQVIRTPEVKEVTELWQSERGTKGFGSSGR